MQNTRANLTKILLVLGLSLLSACDSGTPLSGTSYDYQMLEFRQQGGKGCQGASLLDTHVHCATVQLRYPHFEPDSNAALRAINQLINEEILNFEKVDGKEPSTPAMLATAFINDYLNYPEAPTSWLLDRKLDIIHSNAEIISLRFSETSRTDEPNLVSGQTYFNVATQTGQPLKISDLLVANYESELNAIGERMFREARHIGANTTLEQAGFTFTNGFLLNSNMGITSAGLVFYFNTYEIAPYTMGPTELLIPYAVIKQLIRPDGLLAKLT